MSGLGVIPNLYCWFCGHDWIWRESLTLKVRMCRRCDLISPRKAPW